MRASIITFSEPKAGNSALEWEDGAAGQPDCGDGTARFMVVDGATEAYDSLRWVGQLVSSFVPLGPTRSSAPPRLHELRDWFGLMQDRWVDESPATFATLFEERKFHEDGSFATMLAGELTGLDGPTPCWEAAALGDTVLFHVRDDELVDHFPPLRPADFGLAPDGVHTSPRSLDHMMSRLTHRRGALEPGDTLFVATDAMAHWILEAAPADPQAVFSMLGGLDHPDLFGALVDDQRGSGALKNDDVTLMRIRLTTAATSHLVVCL